MGENLVYNGELEIDSDGDGIPDGWTFALAASGTSSVSLSSNGIEGSNRIAMVADLDAINVIFEIIESIPPMIPIDPDHNYVLRFKHISTAEEGQANVSVRFRDPNLGWQGVITNTFAPATVWTEEEFLLSGIDSDARFMSLRFVYSMPDNPNTLYVDSIWAFKQKSWLDILIDGIFTSDSSGRAKFGTLFVNTALIDDLAVNTAKIASLAVTEAKIDNLAVTTAKIDDLAVDTAKINSLAVTTAKIADAAITNAKIQNGAVQNLSIGSGVIEFDRATSGWLRQSYFSKKALIVSGEAMLGYSGYLAIIPGSGNVDIVKNRINVIGGTGAAPSVRFYSPLATLIGTLDPQFKCRIEKSQSTVGVVWIGMIKAIASAEEMQFKFSDDGTIYAVLGGVEQALQSYSSNSPYILDARYYYNDRVEFGINGVPKYTFDGLQLNVDGRSGAGGWDNLYGSSPYLDAKDYPSKYIKTYGSFEVTQEYSFEDIWAGTSADGIIEVLLLLNIWSSQPEGADGSVEVYDGTSWSSPYSISFPYAFGDYSGYQTVDVSSIFGTSKATVNLAKIRITTGSIVNYYWADHAYLKVKSKPTLLKSNMMELNVYNAGNEVVPIEFKVSYYTSMEDWMY